MSGNSVYKKATKSRKRKNNDENKENILKKQVADIVERQNAMAQICDTCGKKFTSEPLFDSHRFSENKSACKRHLQKVFIHKYRGEVFLAGQDTIKCFCHLHITQRMLQYFCPCMKT